MTARKVPIPTPDDVASDVEEQEPAMTAEEHARRLAMEKPTNVIEALARVQKEIGGIEKRRNGDGGLQYAFRGIDAVSSAAQPLFGRFGIVIVPTVERYVIDEITVNGKPWSDATVEVRWTIYGPGGVDDRIEAVTIGLGRDNSDKPYPKALTQAYKNLLLRVLTIGDPADDNDGITHERDGASGRSSAPTYPAAVVELVDRLKALKDRPDAAEAVKEWAASSGKRLTPNALTEDPEWFVAVKSLLDELDAEHVGDVRDDSQVIDVEADEVES